MNKQEWIENYLCEVAKHLPEKQREDIKEELRTLIDDMLQEKSDGVEATEEDVKAVLTELGDPVALARKYKVGPSHLIGGEYYDKYVFVIKNVLIWVCAVILASDVISFFVHAAKGVEEVPVAMREFLSTPSILLEIFAWITIVFILMERGGVKINMPIETWSLDKLEHPPKKEREIKKGECIAGMVFSAIAIAVFTRPQLLGVWGLEDGSYASVPIFNLEIWHRVLPLFILCFLLGMSKDVVKLIVGHYGTAVVVTTITANMLQMVVAAILLKYFPLFNVNFVNQIGEVWGAEINPNNKWDLFNYWNADGLRRLSSYILLAFGIIYLIDCGTVIYRSLRSKQK